MREALGVLGLTPSATGTRINNALIDNIIGDLKNNPAIAAMLRDMKVRAPDAYTAAIETLLIECGYSVDGPVPAPTPPAPPAPPRPPTPTPPAPPPNPPAPSGDVTAQVFAALESRGFYFRNGMLGIGAPPIDEIKDQIQVFGQQDAGISFIGNLNGRNSQGNFPGLSRIRFDSDLGIRTQHNPDALNPYHNPSIAFAYTGYDREGVMSWYYRGPGEGHDNCQDLILSIESDAKEVTFVSMRPMWNIGFKASRAINDFARKFLAPFQS